MENKVGITPLARIRNLLKKNDYQVRLEPMFRGRQFERLYVGLFQNTKAQLYIAEIAFVNDFEKVLKLKKEFPSRKPELAFLQFYCAFPITFPPLQFTREIPLMLQSINLALPLGSFSFVALDGLIFYQYVYPSEDPMNISESIILEVINITESAMHRLDPIFEKVAAETLSLVDAANKIAEEGLF